MLFNFVIGVVSSAVAVVALDEVANEAATGKTKMSVASMAKIVVCGVATAIAVNTTVKLLKGE